MDAPALAAWIDARIRSGVGRADLAVLVRASVDAALDAPLAEVLPEAAFSRALDVALAESALVGWARGVGPLGFAPLIEALKDTEHGAGRWLTPEARDSLLALAGRHGLVESDWVDVIFSQTASEQVLADTLFRALEDFSETVPKVVQEMTPAALGRLASALGGATSGVRDRVRDEVRRRLEPEIRRFVERATRRLLDGTASYLKSNVDGERAVEARKNLLAHAIDRPFGRYVRQVDAEARGAFATAAESSVRRAEAREALRNLLLGVHRTWLDEAGDRPARAVLAEHGVEVTVDAEAVVDAAWPALNRILDHPEVREVMTRWAEAILDAAAR